MIDEEDLKQDLTDEEDSKKVFNQQDVTRRPRRKAESWLCNEVQESVKTMITECIDNLLKAKT